MAQQQQQQQQQEECNIDILSVFSDDALHNAKDFCAKRIGSLTEDLHEIKRAIKKTKRIEKALDIELIFRFEDNEEEEEEQQGHSPAASSSGTDTNNNSHYEPAPSGAAEELFLGAPPFGMMPKSHDYTNDGNANEDYTPMSSDGTSAGPLQ
eukprot:g4003.t1